MKEIHYIGAIRRHALEKLVNTSVKGMPDTVLHPVCTFIFGLKTLKNLSRLGAKNNMIKVLFISLLLY